MLVDVGDEETNVKQIALKNFDLTEFFIRKFRSETNQRGRGKAIEVDVFCWWVILTKSFGKVTNRTLPKTNGELKPLKIGGTGADDLAWELVSF